jgi:hypothetical protein
VSKIEITADCFDEMIQAMTRLTGDGGVAASIIGQSTGDLPGANALGKLPPFWFEDPPIMVQSN